MSKALVIKGANFAANKIETITLTEVIPCTGISITPTTVAFDTLGATQQITPTLTPVDTTETVYYVSSDTDVATVSASGLITSVGVGSATITVTCGGQSATCAVTATNVVVMDDEYYADNTHSYSNSINLSANPPKNYIGTNSDTTTNRLYYSTDEFGVYRAFSETSNNGKYLIPIPKGASTVTVTPPEGLRTRSYLILANANEKQTYIRGSDGQCALVIAYFESTWNGAVPHVYDISEYTESANGFVLQVFGKNSIASEVTGKTTVVFS